MLNIFNLNRIILLFILNLPPTFKGDLGTIFFQICWTDLRTDLHISPSPFAVTNSCRGTKKEARGGEGGG